MLTQRTTIVYRILIAVLVLCNRLLWLVRSFKLGSSRRCRSDGGLAETAAHGRRCLRVDCAIA